MGKVYKSKQIKEFEPILASYGYFYHHTTGSHFIYYNGEFHTLKAVNLKLNKYIRQRLINEMEKEKKGGNLCYGNRRK